MTIVTNISKWVDGVGVVYTTAYDSREVDEFTGWENAWAVDDGLLNGEDATCTRFKVWDELLDDNGDVIDVSGEYWVESDEYWG